MDERRDLVDREELRRRLKEERSKMTAYDEWHDGWRFGNCAAEIVLNAMPAVECPHGWTRGEVLAELDADPDAVCEWHNPYNDTWVKYDRIDARFWHPEVRRYDVRVVRVAPEPEWVPLTQLVGRTVHKCSGFVDRDPSGLSGEGWRWYDGREWHSFPDGTLNLETGQVAVRPKAAT